MLFEEAIAVYCATRNTQMHSVGRMLNQEANALQSSDRMKLRLPENENRCSGCSVALEVGWPHRSLHHSDTRPENQLLSYTNFASQRLELQHGSALLLSRALNSALFLSLSLHPLLSFYSLSLSLHRMFINTENVSFHSIKGGSPSPNYWDASVYAADRFLRLPGRCTAPECWNIDGVVYHARSLLWSDI
jgi:hypothetical protein